MVLAKATQEQRVRDAVAAISDELNLSQAERDETIPSGSTTLIASRVAWAATYLVQAGLLKRPKRGHFVITEKGQSVLEKDLNILNLAYLKKIPDFIDFMKRKGEKKSADDTSPSKEVPASDKSPEEVIGEAYQELETDLKEQILERVLQNSPAFFEHLVVRLLSSLGMGVRIP